MNPRVTAYFTVVTIAAIGLFAVADPSDLQSLSNADWFGIAGFVFIGLLSDALAIDFGKGTKAAKSSLAFLPFLACTTLFPPAAAMTAVFLVVAPSNFLIWRRRTSSALFNISQGVIAAGISSVVHRLLMGGTPAGLEFVAFSLAALAFFATNMMLSSAALALMQAGSLSRTFLQVIGPGGANLWYDLLASPIAYIATILYSGFHITGIIAIILPLLLIRYSYQSTAQLQAANRDLLYVLVKAIETRDPYTSGHSRRVSALAAAIARDLGFSERRIDTVEQAALLHDIGKIDPKFSEVLQKPYSLTPEERELIQGHSAAGADLLQSLSTVGLEVIEAVRHHHERYDGDGYPAGLSGEQIPVIARIIMVCDSVDAMLSDRPYRSALSIDEVEAELERCKGTQFDPEITETILRSGTLRKNAAVFQRVQVDSTVPG